MKIKIISYNPTLTTLTVVQLLENIVPYVGKEFQAEQDHSIWKITKPLLTPSSILMKGYRHVEIERISDFGQLNTGDVLELISE